MFRLRQESFPVRLFIWMTIAYGIGFILLEKTSLSLGTSSLYVTMLDIGHNVPVAWGLACIIAGVLELLGYDRIAAMVGFMAWMFAGICYGIVGNWFVLLALAGTNMAFWAWKFTH